MKNQPLIIGVLRKLLPCCMSLLAGGLLAQNMEVTDATTAPFTPENLITNIFLGEGVEVLNVTFEGDPISVGYFTKGENKIGIERGVLLTSGRAASANCAGFEVGANCVGSQFASSGTESTATDPDLTSLVNGGVIHDVAKYTITFIPTADTLRFKYVFASEEYPEYSCSPFNDVFGFFISGPGLNGPYQNNAVNIAKIPGTNLPVSINNIHPSNPPGCPALNVQYYHNNNFSNNQPVYDGFTDVFVAEVVVTPCETYTIKLSVCDVSDQAFDTGVFLEAKSFGTGSLKVDVATVSNDGTVTEGCAGGSVTFTLPNEAESDFPLDFTIFGSAINGVDYEEIPADLVIPQGQQSITIHVNAFEDGLIEGLESIGFDVQRDVCNRDTFWLFIRDNEIKPPDLGPDRTTCKGTPQQLDGNLPIPLPDPPTFTNTNHYTFSNITPAYSPIIVAGVQPFSLGPGVIRSVCVNIEHKWVDDIDLFLISPGGQFIELSSDNGSNCDNYNNVCFSPTATIPIDYLSPWPPCASNVEAPFSGGTFQPEGVWEDLWDGNYPTNGTWQLLALDDQAGFNGTILDWTITFEPLYQVYYQWEPADGLSCVDCPDPVATPDTSTTYLLTAWDTYGCEVKDTIEIQINDVLPAPDVHCTIITDNSITFEWDNVPGAMGYLVNVEGAGWTVPNNGPLSHIATGLTLDQTITIEVHAISECDGLIGTATCSTPSCDGATLSLIGQTGVTCFGDEDGSLTISATGGAGGYVFHLGAMSNTTGTFTELGAGPHLVTVVDAWDCPSSIEVTIPEPDSISLQDSILSHITCKDAADGSATVVVSGGVYPYNFTWNNGQMDSIALNLTPGQQTVIVTDDHGCTNMLSLEIEEPELLALNLSADSVKCFGTNTGAALVLIAGGTAPYLVQWDGAAGNATTPLVENLGAGSYSVFVTDANGCQATAFTEVGQPLAISSDIVAQELSCHDAGDGSATVTAGNGTPGYSYLWSNNSTEAMASSLNAEEYFVTITDAKGCTTVDSVTITEPPVLEVTLSPAAATCTGASDGSIASQATGGTPPYTYTWSNAEATPVLQNLKAGSYCLTITDVRGCTAVACAEVAEPPALMLSAVPTQVSCNGGSDGQVDLTTLGGTIPYAFLWNNGVATEDATDLTAGTYVVTVTDANGCTASISQPVVEPDALLIQPMPVHVLCKGESTGSISVSVTGGTGTYQFEWTGQGGFISGQQNPTNLSAGSYTLEVTDGNGCSEMLQVDLLEPATGVEVAIGQPEMICFGAVNGTATATATGGTLPYSYLWNNGQTSAVASGLAAAVYEVTVTDANGCKDSEQVQIQQQDVILVSLEQTAAKCYNGKDGTASVAAITQGGNSLPIADFSITWSPGNLTTPVINGLTGGQTYAVTVANNLGCIGTASITIGNPTPLTAKILATQDVRCAGGSDGIAEAGGMGGTPPYSYLWSNNQTTAVASNLPTGTFTVTVSDANGCTATAQVGISVPSPLILNFKNEPVKCYGEANGASVALPEGGKPPYAYNWSNGGSAKEINALAAGAYTLTLTDANGCELVKTTEISQPGNPLFATVVTQDVSCYGYKDGQIQILGSGGTLPYVYSLDGENFSGNSVQIALPSAGYQIFIKDKNDCVFEMDGIFISQPLPILVDLGPDTIVLYNTELILHPVILNAGEPDSLIYQWSSNNPQTPALYPNRQEGYFTVTSPTTAWLSVMDKNGCHAEDRINIFVRKIRSIEVPTAFAPGQGGDLSNDLLHVHGSTQIVEKVRLFRVFDRWGELLYEAGDFPLNDLNTGWDGTFRGKDMPPGVYVWYVEIDFVDGSSASYKGQTTLIR